MQCEVVSKYFLALNSLMQNQKEPRDYGRGIILYYGEVNLLRMIELYPEINAVGLSKRLNVTRGAITQWGNKLAKKGLIYRYSKEGNNKEKYYRLTEWGDEVLKTYQKRHQEANEEMCSYLSCLEGEERNIIINFLEMASMLPINEFECHSVSCEKEERT